jgi:hypothetical protein
MNQPHFNGLLDRIHYITFFRTIPRHRVRDDFLKKKLSDFYFSKLIPDFFYHTPLSNNYYPTIFATRVTLSFSFFLIFSWIVYRKCLSQKKEHSKKYQFNFFSKKYLNYEKELILFEKSRKNKIILN